MTARVFFRSLTRSVLPSEFARTNRPPDYDQGSSHRDVDVRDLRHTGHRKIARNLLGAGLG